MSRRPAPRPASAAFRTALERASPKTRLAAMQAVWADLVGERIAAAARPASERDGVVTVACSDSVWAQELDLMQDRLRQGLEERLGEAAPRSLRFRVDDE